jgi:hypothetical protein
MVEPAQDRHDPDRAVVGPGWQSSSRRIRDLLLESLMGSRSIEVGHIRLEDPRELLLMQDEQVIQTLAAHTPQKPFTARVGSRSPVGCPQELDPGPARHPPKERTELGVVVTDQEARRLPKGRRFSQLLGNPGIGRMASHPDMDDFSAPQLNEKEGKERAEEQVGDWQEVTGPDLMRMGVEKGGPPLRGGPHAMLSHVLLDSPLGDVYAYLEQFATDAFSSPQAIVSGHGLKQRDRLGRDFGFPRGRLRSLSPVPAKCVTMPAEEGVRMHNEECLFPSSDSSREHYQENAISLGIRWTLHVTAKDDELLTKQRVFGDKFRPGTGKIGTCSAQPRASGWLRPPEQALVHSTGTVVDLAFERVEQT